MRLGAEERDDAALLRGVARGDEEALAALYDRHAGWLTVRLTRRWAMPDVVDHAMQDTFLALWRRLGYLPQELGYHRHFTVAGFLDYVAILKEITNRRRRAEEVARVLAAIGLERRARTRIRALSGGMRQRLGIAQALLGRPDLLILDEPTAGLDPEQRLRFRELLSDLPGDPVIVLSTHQADDIAAICPQVVVLLQGRIRFAGTPAELAATAAGRVWTADERDTRAHLSWRGGDNRWRHIGDAHPAGAELVAPTVEDGYLLRSHAAGVR